MIVVSVLNCHVNGIKLLSTPQLCVLIEIILFFLFLLILFNNFVLVLLGLNCSGTCWHFIDLHCFGQSGVTYAVLDSIYNSLSTQLNLTNVLNSL